MSTCYGSVAAAGGGGGGQAMMVVDGERKDGQRVLLAVRLSAADNNSAVSKVNVHTGWYGTAVASLGV